MSLGPSLSTAKITPPKANGKIGRRVVNARDGRPDRELPREGKQGRAERAVLPNQCVPTDKPQASLRPMRRAATIGHLVSINAARIALTASRSTSKVSFNQSLSQSRSCRSRSR
jgi:hypothetical protein